MKRILFHTVFALTLSAMIAIAYGQVTQPGAPGGAAEGPLTGSLTAPTADSSIDPVIQAIELNNAEIALAKIALGKAQNAKVKVFADMLVKDHMAALTKLRNVQGVTNTDTKPNARHQATAERLSKIFGSEFDREYLRAVVSEHQEAVKFFEQQSKADSAVPAPGNTTLAKVSQELTPIVRAHLQEAQNILKDLEMTPSKANTNRNRNSNSDTILFRTPVGYR
jgi:Predicted outer membrane protein